MLILEACYISKIGKFAFTSAHLNRKRKRNLSLTRNPHDSKEEIDKRKNDDAQEEACEIS